MSTSLAIAAVTIALRNLLFKEVNAEPGLAGTLVSTQPPDRARTTNNLINIFLYHTAPNAAWRNMDLQGVVKPGETGQPPLALNLHYLVTAYTDNDDEKSHRLIGKAMSTLHDHPVLDSTEINDALADSLLQDQVERIRVVPESVSIEDISKLWATFSAPYRISAAYQASVVLIESTRAVKAPLPVLKRGPADQGAIALASPSPMLTEVRPPTPQPGAQPGDILSIIGQNLDSDGLTVMLTNPYLVAPIELLPAPGGTAETISVKIPDAADDPLSPSKWAAGIYTATGIVRKAGLPSWTTNEIPFALSPRLIGIAPGTAPRDLSGNVTLTLTCIPQIRPGQRVTLLIGDRQIAVATIPAPAGPTAPTVLTVTV
ncbi:MAG: DUF4255 domain-containing protein, partial [Bacteroidota bacterium]